MQEDLGFGVLSWVQKVIITEKIADGRVLLPARSGYISENRGIQSWRKVNVAGYAPPFFGYGRVKVSVDHQLCPFHVVNK